MPLIDFASAQEYISKLSNKSEREKLLSLYLTLPYQKINDSPTLKHYTDWSRFDNLNLQIKEFVGDEKINIEGYEKVVYPSDKIESKEDVTNQLIKPEEHKLVALTLALTNKVVISSSSIKSKRLLFYHSSAEGLLSPLNLEVYVEDGDHLDFVYISEGKRAMTSAVISFNVGKDSQLNLSIINLSQASFVYSKALVKGEVNTTIFTSKSFVSHVNYSLELMENASSNFSAKAVGLDNDNINVRVNVIHKGIRSKSEGVLKAISTDSALSVIGGDAVVSEEALDSSTSIIGRAYNIGKDSKAVVAPMLEVKTGRVQLAKHSASVSRVPDELIFYLESRGFSRKEAESMIIKGFIVDENDPPFLERIIDEILTEAKVLVSV